MPTIPIGQSTTLYSDRSDTTVNTTTGRSGSVDLGTGEVTTTKDGVTPHPGSDTTPGQTPTAGSGVSTVLSAVSNLIPRYSATNRTQAGTSTTGSTTGQVTIGGVTAQGTATATATASATAQTSFTTGPDGLNARATVEARLGVSVTASGSITSALGTIQGNATATAELVARADHQLHIGPDGVTASGVAQVGATVSVTADADVNLLGGMVTGKFNGRAEAGAGARAAIGVAFTYDPLRASVEANVGAFAGARAGFTARAGVAGFNVGIGMEARVGVGFEAGIKAGIEDGKLNFSFNLGIALGIGFSIKIDFSIDLKPIGDAFAKLFGELGKLFGGGQSAPDTAQLSTFVQDFMGKQLKTLGETTETEEPPPDDELESEPSGDDDELLTPLEPDLPDLPPGTALV